MHKYKIKKCFLKMVKFKILKNHLIPKPTPKLLWEPMHSHVPGKNIRGLATLGKSWAVVPLHPCLHSQHHKNFTHSYLRRRNQSMTKNCMQLGLVSILLAKTVTRANIHWWPAKREIVTKTKTKCKARSTQQKGKEDSRRNFQAQCPFFFFLTKMS